MGKTTDIGVAFGIAVRKIRLAKGLTQEQLGFEAGLRRTFISSIELNEKQPSLKTIQNLAQAFGIPPSKLLQLAEFELKKR
jgi:transcriptional regulator with XRE-family HTH domain